MQDGQRALQLIRSQAAKWRIKKDRVGVLGVSAGGHLASWIGTAAEDITAIHDSIQKNSFQPDFMILISPVIDMGRYANQGSRQNLLGNNPSEALIRQYSTQNRVTVHTPPCLIFDAADDKVVTPENSVLFYEALLNNKITTGFHVFPQGGHTINVNGTTGSTSQWKALCEAWLRETGFIGR
jgi:acetyl esterase/lipase